VEPPFIISSFSKIFIFLFAKNQKLKNQKIFLHQTLKDQKFIPAKIFFQKV